MAAIQAGASNNSTFSDYNIGVSPSSSGEGGESEKVSGFWALGRLKRSYLDYLGAKVNEFEEQKDARRYRHGTQYTSAQIKVLNKRKQPIVTYNHIGPKINGVIGLIEKLRQDPQAFPRTPKEQEGADLATAVIRYVLDEQAWKEKSPICAEDGAVDGIGGIEILIEKGDEGDAEVGFEIVEPDSFFYDPRSYTLDFSDCRFMGQAKWFDLEHAVEMFPEFEDKLQGSIESGTELTTNADREQKWFISEGDIKRVRIVDEWYRSGGTWHWCIYTGSLKLLEGVSPLLDEKGRTMCKYVMFSASIDQDGDRYGFVRQFKSAQDEINQRRSKALHILNMRRIIAEKGAFDNIEQTRTEATRPDGVVVYNKGFEMKFDDDVRLQETEAQLKFLQEAKTELDNYGPTLSLIGEQAQDLSGRAIALQQQAGISQLGPFILSYKGWKIRVYRALWNAVRKYWTKERWIRVTDDPNSIQFVGINQVGVHPQTGMPTMVNQVAVLDVDIIMDEGMDMINMQADTYESLMALAQAGAQIPPGLLIEASPLDGQTKAKYLKMLSTPDPLAQTKQSMELQNAQVTIAKTAAQAKLANAQAISALQGEKTTVEQPDNPAVIAADVELSRSKAALHQAQALQTLHQTVAEPQQVAHDQMMDKVGAVQQARAQTEPTVPVAPPPPTPQDLMAVDKHRMSVQDHNFGIAERRLKVAHTIEDRRSARDKEAKENKASKDKEDHSKAMMEAIMNLHGGMDRIGQHVASLHEKVDGVTKDMHAPTEIVRDAKGRAVGVKKGSREMKIERDKSGRMVGAQ